MVAIPQAWLLCHKHGCYATNMVAMPQARLLCHKHGAFMYKIFKVREKVYLLMAYRTGDPRFSLFLMKDAGDKKENILFLS